VLPEQGRRESIVQETERAEPQTRQEHIVSCDNQIHVQEEDAMSNSMM